VQEENLRNKEGKRIMRRLGSGQSWSVRFLLCPLLLALAAPLGFAWPEEPVPAASVLTLDLSECLEMALQRQPRVAVQRASLAAALDGQRALDALRFAGLVAPEIPVRRQQAALGVTAAAAGVDQAERESNYAVTRTYLTVLYAREQERTARGVVDRLTATHKTAKEQLDAGAKEVTDADVRRTMVYLRLARTKQIQAGQGMKRALAALKEAVGLGPDDCLEVPEGQLAASKVSPCLADVVPAALARRGEMIQATVFAEVACLEVKAQRQTLHKKMETFAAGADIHSRQVPQGIHNKDYRPGAVPPEMPTVLAGSRAERVQHAQSLHARAEAVVEATRNLITLETVDAFLRWQEESSQLEEAKGAVETADLLAKDLNKDFIVRAKVRVEEVVNAHVLAAQAKSQYTEFLYRTLLALAELERVTAGGFCAQLAEAFPAVTKKDTPNP
jgi:outer membrane protein TolC